MSETSKGRTYESIYDLGAYLVENAQIVIPEDGVVQKLEQSERENRPLRVKMGFDPTSPDLHLGHAVAMRQLKRFQDLGHLPVIIIGDFTGLIGDPSGSNKSRPPVTPEELEHNASTYLDQLGKILDVSKAEVHRNSEWLSQMSMAHVIDLLSQASLSQVITRDDFRRRLDANSPIGLHEIIYPFLQGVDSMAIEADIELGGVDQLHASQAARMLQGKRGIEPQASILMPLLVGLDGRAKMSKSLGNYIGLNDDAREMFGKVMSIPDNSLEQYLRLISSFSNTTIEQLLDDMKEGRNPMEVKLLLASDVTTIYHDEELAAEANNYFHTQFRDRISDPHYELAEVDAKIDSTIDLLVALNLAKSKSQARRLIEQGGVSINQQRISMENERIDAVDGLLLRVGRRRYYRLQASSK